MKRFLVERTWPNGLEIPMDDKGNGVCQAVIGKNSDVAVTWVHSYVNADKTKTFCIYDGPSPEAIRQAAEANNQPVDSITEVRILDPYFFH